MVEYSKRFLLAIIMTIIISLLIIGSKQSIAKAESIHNDNPKWVWPTDGVITDTYGTRNGKHKGIDIAKTSGTPVIAVDGGVVTKSYYSDSYGHVVFIKHDSGYETVYAHLEKRYVEEGKQVKKGETIGKMGSTGHSSGPHLHFEVHKHEWTVSKENAMDPFDILGEGEVGQFVIAGKEQLEPFVEVLNEVDKSIHIVQEGETLWGIAQKYSMSIETIQKNNLLEDDIIYPNQKLKIKGSY